MSFFDKKFSHFLLFRVKESNDSIFLADCSFREYFCGTIEFLFGSNITLVIPLSNHSHLSGVEIVFYFSTFGGRVIILSQARADELTTLVIIMREYVAIVLSEAFYTNLGEILIEENDLFYFPIFLKINNVEVILFFGIIIRLRYFIVLSILTIEGCDTTFFIEHFILEFPLFLFSLDFYFPIFEIKSEFAHKLFDSSKVLIFRKSIHLELAIEVKILDVINPLFFRDGTIERCLVLRDRVSTIVDIDFFLSPTEVGEQEQK